MLFNFVLTPPHIFANRFVSVLLMLLLFAFASGCSSDETDGTLPAGTESPTEGGVSDEAGDESGVDFPDPDKEGGEGDTPAIPVTMLTIATPQEVQAGSQVDVICVAMDADNAVVEGVESFFLITESVGPYHISEGQVSFEVAGEYRIQCQSQDGAIQDPNGALVHVIAGDGAEVNTALSTDYLVAGEKVTVSCTVHDAFGNLNEWTPVDVVTNPEGGWVGVGLVLKFFTADVYDVACRIQSNGLVDTTPEVLEVVAHVPKNIITLLEEEVIEAGESTGVSCLVTDHYDNPILDFPVALQYSPELDLDGVILSTVVAGLYPVKCVPATDPWEFFNIEGAVLHVMPGPPFEILVEQVPPKAVYQKNDQLELMVSVLDEFANVIPDAPLEPVTIEPPEGVKTNAPFSYQLKAEGQFVFGIVSAEDPLVNIGVEILVDGTGPSIIIEEPPRGATLTGKPAINVSGYAADDVAGVVSVEINGQDVDLKPDGTFTHIVVANQGMNMLVAVAVDLGGKVTETSRAFYYSSHWYDISLETPQPGHNHLSGMTHFFFPFP